jgi:hypothetical protein
MNGARRSLSGYPLAVIAGTSVQQSVQFLKIGERRMMPMFPICSGFDVRINGLLRKKLPKSGTWMRTGSFLARRNQMSQGKQRMRTDHPGPRVLHHRFDFRFLLGFVTMNPAFGANRFVFTIRAFERSVPGVLE